MALEEIAVADIRKGQTILEVDRFNGKVGTRTFEIDESWTPSNSVVSNFYLLQDAREKPLFEVPWGTVQRDCEGDIWEFFDEDDGSGYVADVGGIAMSAKYVAQAAPYTRLYTVQELIDIYREFDRVGFAEVLANDRHDGII